MDIRLLHVFSTKIMATVISEVVYKKKIKTNQTDEALKTDKQDILVLEEEEVYSRCFPLWREEHYRQIELYVHYLVQYGTVSSWPSEYLWSYSHTMYR